MNIRCKVGKRVLYSETWYRKLNLRKKKCVLKVLLVISACSRFYDYQCIIIYFSYDISIFRCKSANLRKCEKNSFTTTTTTTTIGSSTCSLPTKKRLAMPQKLDVPFKSVPGRNFKAKLRHLLPKGCYVWLICPWFDDVGDGIPHLKTCLKNA